MRCYHVAQIRVFSNRVLPFEVVPIDSLMDINELSIAMSTNLKYWFMVAHQRSQDSQNKQWGTARMVLVECELPAGTLCRL